LTGRAVWLWQPEACPPEYGRLFSEERWEELGELFMAEVGLDAYAVLGKTGLGPLRRSGLARLL
jgi:hypothetical protein